MSEEILEAGWYVDAEGKTEYCPRCRSKAIEEMEEPKESRHCRAICDGREISVVHYTKCFCNNCGQIFVTRSYE